MCPTEVEDVYKRAFMPAAAELHLIIEPLPFERRTPASMRRIRWPRGGCHSRFELFRSDAEIGHVAQDANDIFVGESIVPHRKRDADIGRVDLDVIVNGAHCDF